MRALSILIALCVLAFILGLSGCAKKVQSAEGAKVRKVVFVKGTCAVCGKSSDKLIEFQVPHGSKIFICPPDLTPDCVRKVSMRPEKYGGSASGGVSGRTPGSVSGAASAPPAGLGGTAKGDTGRSSAGAPPGASAGTAPPPPAGGKVLTAPPSGN